MYKIFFLISYTLYLFLVYISFLLFYVVEDVNIQMIPFYVLSHAKIKLGNFVSSVFSCRNIYIVGKVFTQHLQKVESDLL